MSSAVISFSYSTKKCHCVSIVLLLLAFQLGLSFVLPKRSNITSTFIQRDSTSSIDVCTTEACKSIASYIRASIDVLADPCDDFYKYSCGLWKRLNPISEEKGRTSSFRTLADSISSDLKNLLNTLSRDKYKERSIQLLSNIYKKCLDTDTVEAAGVAPLKNHISMVFGTTPNENGMTMISRASGICSEHREELAADLYLKHGISVLVSPYAGPDMKNNDVNVLGVDQASLGLGSNSETYYLEDDDLYRRVRDEYLLLMRNVSAYLWNENPDAPPTQAQMDDALEILNFEIKLAGLIKPASERRDPTTMYNMISLDEMGRFGSNFDMQKYLMHFNVIGDVNIDEPQYIKHLNELLEITPPDVVNGYCLWRLILSRLHQLAPPLSDYYYNFTKTYHDAGRNPDREDYCVKYVIGGIGDGNERLGYAVGRLFIDLKNFNSETKNQLNEMIGELFKSFKVLLDKNDWMDEETKAKAQLKIEQMLSNVGYPDVVVDDLDSLYVPLLEEMATFHDTKIMDCDSFYEINNKLITWSTQRKNAKVGTPYDRHIFSGSPAIVNAWFGPQRNSITFPAGVLQRPFYDIGFPMYVNFGAIGTVIGHELSHSFDDRGSQFDGVGKLIDWWTEKSREQFEQRAQCMIDQYSAFCYPNLGEDVCVKGFETQGENIADNGGVIQSFYAYKNYMKDKEDLILPSFEEFTPEQLFFISFGMFDCENHRDAALINQLMTDEHAPGKDRITGVLQNFDEFSNAFNCPIGSNMNPSHKCSIW